MASMFPDVGHGHSHGSSGECAGHQHGQGFGGQMSDEMKMKMLQQFKARMAELQASGKIPEGLGHSHGPGGDGHGHSHGSGDECQGHGHSSSYNGFLYGYGHDSEPEPVGWDSFIPPPPPSSVPSNEKNEMSDQMKHVLIDAYNTTVAQSRDNFWTINIPGLGRLRIVRDWAGLCQSSVILLYWLYGNWSTWNAIILPHYADGNIPLIFILFYAAVSVLCITSFIRASTSNPGSLHLSHVPQDDWTECHMCKHLRPPQSHHCRRCGQCVRRMDHHCPWINNCVGEENQFAFMQLLLYACMLSISSLAVQAFHFFFLNACVSCDKESFVIQHQTSIILVCVVMGVFMAFGAGGLLITQHIGVIYETTTLEWMKIQQEIFMTGNIPEKMPEQTKSCYQVYSTLCGTGFWFLWIFPCRRRHPIFGKFSIV